METISFNEVREAFAKEVLEAKAIDDIEKLKVKYMGRKGVFRRLQDGFDFQLMSAKEKKRFGIEFNTLKKHFEETMIEVEAKLVGDNVTLVRKIDVSLPGKDSRIGAIHPVNLVQIELEAIFQGMGFSAMTGPEVVSEFNNFDALNIPNDHPARDMQDTYWLKNGMVLRTHTSSNQVPALKKFGAPLRVIFPGRCFRYENVDASHENTFYQLEGLMVDRDISVAHLIGVMKTLLSEVFHRDDVKIRLRPGYFPFVEPGFELDIQCLLCGGKGCLTCRTGWIELIPCGMVHPMVLKHGGVDPSKYTGFAFGLGLTRLAMMKFSIPEIRLFNCGDIRFNSQFIATV